MSRTFLPQVRFWACRLGLAAIVLFGYLDSLITLGFSVLTALSGYYFLSALMILRSFITNPIIHSGLAGTRYLSHTKLFLINILLAALIAYPLLKTLS